MVCLVSFTECLMNGLGVFPVRDEDDKNDDPDYQEPDSQSQRDDDDDDDEFKVGM